MNDGTFEEILRATGALIEKMKPGPDCPPDYVLLDYAYEDLSEQETRSISEHIASCEKCLFEVMKMEADRFGWKQALGNNPDATVAQALGPDGLKRLSDAMENKKESVGPPSLYIDRMVSFTQRYSSRLQAGWDKFQAAMAVAQEWLSEGGHKLAVPLMRGTRSTESTSIHRLGAEPPVYLASISRFPNIKYQTLIMLRLQSKDAAILYENRNVQWPLHISPLFSEEDIGMNLLYLILTANPLKIREDEEVITPDRFVEIMAQAEQTDDEPIRVVTFEVEVQGNV